MGRLIFANLFMILVKECFMGKLIFAHLFMILVEECYGMISICPPFHDFSGRMLWVD